MNYERNRKYTIQKHMKKQNYASKRETQIKISKLRDKSDLSNQIFLGNHVMVMMVSTFGTGE